MKTSLYFLLRNFLSRSLFTQAFFTKAQLNSFVYGAVIPCFLFLFLMSCGKIELACDSETGRNAIVEEVNKALNTSNCASAISIIDPYYTKEGCGTDQIRLARAAAYACNAGVNFFANLDSLANSNLSSNTAFFDTLAGMFPSTASDSKVASGTYALDALFALQNPGSVNTASQLIYSTSVSPGTLVPSNRTIDSNVYSMMTSMALIGALHNRAGLPNASHTITQKLGKVGGSAGWEVAANMTSDGCAYAGSMMAFVDSVSQVSQLLIQRFGSATASSLTNVATTLLLDTACSAGCSGVLGSGCALSCTACPDALRGRVACVVGATANTDTVSCAASGIVKMVNLFYGL